MNCKARRMLVLGSLLPLLAMPAPAFAKPAAAAKPAAPAPTASLSMGDPGLLLQVFGRRSCVESGFAIKLLSQKSLPVRLIDIEDPDNVTMEPRLITETKSYKTPYVFVRGRYLGDYQALEKLEKSKALDALLFEGDGGVKG